MYLSLTPSPSHSPPHTPPSLPLFFTSSFLHTLSPQPFSSSHPPPSTLLLCTPSPLNPSPLHSHLSFPSTLLSMQLFDIVVRYDTLRNVINSVTRNLKSIVLTAILALILIFLYSIFGYVFFPDDFLLPTHPKEAIEYTCSDDGEWL